MGWDNYRREARERKTMDERSGNKLNEEGRIGRDVGGGAGGRSEHVGITHHQREKANAKTHGTRLGKGACIKRCKQGKKGKF